MAAPTTINFINPLNTLSFCSNRLNPKFVDQLIKTHKGLHDLKELEQQLAQGHYIPVLTAVWSERDRPKRLDWLRRQENHLHAPLLAELAMAEFAANPTADTLHRISIPLLRAANFRTYQDSKGVNDLSLADCGTHLEMTYSMALNKLCQNKLKKPLAELSAPTEEIRKQFIQDKLKKVIDRSLKISLPSPEWIGYHGMQAIVGKVTLFTQEEITSKRNQFALDTLHKLK